MKWWQALLLLLGTVVAYQGLRLNHFVYEGIPLVFSSVDGWGMLRWSTRPITMGSFILTQKLVGFDARYWHFTNLAIHLVNGILVGTVAKRLGITPWVASGVFLLHPMQSEAVAYISGRGELLAAMFLLAALLAGPLAWRFRFHVVLFPVFVALALASKESAVVIVGILFLGRFCRAWQYTFAMELVSLGVVSMSAFLLLIVHTPAGPDLAGRVHWAMLQATAAWMYVGQSILPIRLSIEHDLLSVPFEAQCLFLFAWLSWPAYVWALFPRFRRFAFCLGWIWVTASIRLLIPLLPAGYFAEHQWYLPFVGFSLLMGSLAQYAFAPVIRRHAHPAI